MRYQWYRSDLIEGFILLTSKRLSLSRVIYLVGGDSVEYYNSFFKQQRPNIKAKYEELLLKKPSLPLGMTADMCLAYDEIEKVEYYYDLFNVFVAYHIIHNYVTYRKPSLEKLLYANLSVPKNMHY